MIKHFLQGRPFGHPLHPLLVHLPIGLFILSLLFDVAARWFNAGNVIVQAAFYTMALGVVMGLVAAITGFADWSDIRTDRSGKSTATAHMTLNLLVIGGYALNLGLRFGDLDAAVTEWLPLILSLAGVGVLMVSGYLGGLLVYDAGIAIGRHRGESDGPFATVELNHSTTDNGYTLIPGAAQLGEGERLRVEINDYVLVVTHHAGSFFALQEFCTHLFGPLSEGKLEGGQIQCPWHQSCFDLHSGQVTQGPAQLPLRTYPVMFSEGELYVRTPGTEHIPATKPEMAHVA
ncbi:MAG: DUF2231 domain-containing protein [Anaerolineales bacterium]